MWVRFHGKSNEWLVNSKCNHPFSIRLLLDSTKGSCLWAQNRTKASLFYSNAHWAKTSRPTSIFILYVKEKTFDEKPKEQGLWHKCLIQWRITDITNKISHRNGDTYQTPHSHCDPDLTCPLKSQRISNKKKQEENKRFLPGGASCLFCFMLPSFALPLYLSFSSASPLWNMMCKSKQTDIFLCMSLSFTLLLHIPTPPLTAILSLSHPSPSLILQFSPFLPFSVAVSAFPRV